MLGGKRFLLNFNANVCRIFNFSDIAVRVQKVWNWMKIKHAETSMNVNEIPHVSTFARILKEGLHCDFYRYNSNI